MSGTFEEKVYKSLGDGANPVHIEGILRKSPAEILEWIEMFLEGAKPTLAETKMLAEQARSDSAGGALDLGLRILDSNFKTLAFITEELIARNEAINI